MPRARVIEVIESDLEVRGAGAPSDPARRVTQYYSKDGRLLAEHDPQVGHGFQVQRRADEARDDCTNLRSVCKSNRACCELALKMLRTRHKPQSRIAEASRVLEDVVESLQRHQGQA